LDLCGSIGPLSSSELHTIVVDAGESPLEDDELDE
jgi:hypothetical protein